MEVLLLGVVVLGSGLLLLGAASSSGTDSVIFGFLVLLVAVPIAAATAARQWLPSAPTIICAVASIVAWVALSSSPAGYALVPGFALVGVPRSPSRRIRLATFATSVAAFVALLLLA